MSAPKRFTRGAPTRKAIGFYTLPPERQDYIRRTCAHEAAHLVVAAKLGWRVEGVTVFAESGPDGSIGISRCFPPIGLSENQLLAEHSIIAAAGAIADGGEGDESDDFHVRSNVKQLIGKRHGSVVHAQINAEARAYFTDPQFRRAVSDLADAILENDGELDAEQISASIARSTQGY